MKRLRFYAVAATIGWSFLALSGWVAIMAVYFVGYDLIENRALPVAPALRSFDVSRWDEGYFYAKGTYDNKAETPEGELVLNSQEIVCDKSNNECVIASVNIIGNYMDDYFIRYQIASWTNSRIIFSDDSPICVKNTYIVDRYAESFTLLTRKKAVIPDYALKSQLKPCGNLKDENVTLADGGEVYWRKKMAFKAQNRLYFDAVLVLMNIAYFALVVWLWRRRRRTAIGNVEM
ncbi:hypothetical protein [Novosphingobium aerophilum]|uniref:Uncharacterized protein n=1 Tax=Novosphingobium aerophilum TaxID=2839843 RepID=A0A7X1KCJ1_9SPHN|nr:hypothetical protein [Novosphingobium aerophilum]MBC2652356.1 hypothetical protein [Novosphingobium aerophilum]